jgi:hypothetical protein
LKLIDVETGEAAEVSLDPLLLDEYVARLADWQEGWRRFCGPRAIHYKNIVTDQPWDVVIHSALRREGVIR